MTARKYDSRRFRASATLASLVVALAFLSASAILILQAQETALDRYVNSRDPVYGWKLINTAHGEGYQAFVLELTSQTWRTAAEVDRPVWKHWLTIVKPLRTTSRTAMLFIGGGSNDNPAPTAADLRTISYALESNTIVADLGMVPNQPLAFVGSKDKRRSEDDLIAYTRVKHFSTKDDTWLVRLAMVKSGVRAMDAIQEFLASEAGGRLTVDRFVVSGGSKRGWTTWLVGAVDDRVVAIMPTVIDALNSELITRHHFEAMGFFSSALNDYVNHGLFPHKIGTPEYRAVLDIEDPYVYRHRARLRIPKYLVHASGDQFFLPDNSRFYFKDLEGEKYIRYVPNTRHNLGGSDARESLLTFYQSILANRPRPKFSWTRAADGSIRVEVTDRPTAVNLWQATNPKARDFRLDVIGAAYTSTPLTEESPGMYLARVPRPVEGFTAFFVELIFDSGFKNPWKFTTEVSVVPDILPFRWEDAKAKYPPSGRP
jgi:PhoPQ-activated pathogenicity-related protein